MASIYPLRDITRIINHFGDKSSRLIFRTPKSPKHDTQSRQLARKFALPLSQETEDDWANEILGCKADNRRYTVLRSHLKRWMLTRLSHLDIREGSEYRKAIYRSAREVFWIRMLVMFEARQAAMWLIPRALERAKKFELTRDQIELYLLLRQNALLDADKSKFLHYAEELEWLERLLMAELRLRALNEAIGIEAVARVEITERGRKLAQEARKEAAEIFEKHKTFNIGLEYFRIATLSAESNEDVEELLRLCRQAEKFLGTFPHLHAPLSRGQFAIKRFRAAAATMDFEAANKAIPDCERQFPKGRNNWFIWKEIEIFLRLREKNFAEAAQLHKEVLAEERFSSQPEQVRQKWAYFGHYAAFALWSLNQFKPHKSSHDFSQVLKDTPVFTRDKVGFNASLLILQQLLYAAMGNDHAMFEKGDALRQYIKRNLRGKRRSRVYAFIRTLLTLHATDFDVAKTEHLAARHIARFHQRPDTLVDEKETFPYYMAWEWIVELVRKSHPEDQKQTGARAASRKRSR